MIFDGIFSRSWILHPLPNTYVLFLLFPLFFLSFLFFSLFLSFSFSFFFFGKRHKCSQALVAVVSWRSVFSPEEFKKRIASNRRQCAAIAGRSIVVSVGAIQRMRANAYQRCTTIPGREKERERGRERRRNRRKKASFD